MIQSQPSTISARARALAVPLLMGLLLIIIAALGLVYWQQRNQKAQIEGQLVQLYRVVNQPREGLQGLRAQVNETKALIPKDLKETEVYPVIRELAAQSGVVVRSQTVIEEKQDKIGNKVYRVMPFKVQVGGEGVTYQQMLNFITNLETQQRLPTLFIEKASINQSEGITRASIDFKLYVQPQAATTPTPTPTPKS